jgi:CDP-glycerol glycerophosphotransferase (TagB/SpsB family)
MLAGKPIIFNFFDKDLYERMRGFSYDPVEVVCAGPIVKSKEELKSAIINQLNDGNDFYKEKYEWVLQLTHKYTDGNSSERIYSLVNELRKEKQL